MLLGVVTRLKTDPFYCRLLARPGDGQCMQHYHFTSLGCRSICREDLALGLRLSDRRGGRLWVSVENRETRTHTHGPTYIASTPHGTCMASYLRHGPPSCVLCHALFILSEDRIKHAACRSGRGSKSTANGACSVPCSVLTCLALR